MRVQEYNTGSTSNAQDLLYGSWFIEKGKYKSKNFKLKDILTNIKAGLPAKEGVLSIKLVTQEDGEQHETPEDLINQSEESLIVPPYAVTIVRMLNGAVYLFSRTDNEFGANAYQCDPSDFIHVNPSLGAELSALGDDLDFFDLAPSDTQKSLNKAINDAFKARAGQAEYENNFNVQKTDNAKTVFVETGGNNLVMFIPVLLQDGFEAEFIQVGEGDVSITMSDSSNLVGKSTIGGHGKAVKIIKRISDQKIYAI